jgi:glutathione peroxidase
LQFLGFPCNQFAGQEPGDNDELLNGLKYVRPGGGFVPSFPLTQKGNVNGLLQDPLWAYIKSVCPAAVDDLSDITPSWTPITTRDVAWNFEAVLFDHNGYAYRRYATAVDPRDTETDIATLLASM